MMLFKINLTRYFILLYLLFANQTILADNNGEARANPQEQHPASQTENIPLPTCVQNLISTYLEEEGDQTVLSFKEECKRLKDKASTCCKNPNACTSLALDISKGVLAMAPAMYSTYTEIKTSIDVNKDKISAEQYKSKMCDAHNNMQLGTFGSQLLLQISDSITSTCRGKINKCQKKCNSRIQAFKQDYKNCFSPILPENKTDKNITTILNYIRESFKNRHCSLDFLEDDSLNNLEKAENFNYNTIKYFNNEEEATEDGEPCPVPDEILAASKLNGFIDGKHYLTYAIMFNKVYKNSSYYHKDSKRKPNLRENSDEKDIVSCDKIIDRVPPLGKMGAGRPIPPPVMQLCKNVLDNVFCNPDDNSMPHLPACKPTPPPLLPKNRPNINPTSTTNPTTSFTGGTPKHSWLHPNENSGIKDPSPEEEGFEGPNQVPFANIRASNSPGGGGPAGGSPGGGASPGGGSPGGGSKDSSPKKSKSKKKPGRPSVGAFGSFPGGHGSLHSPHLNKSSPQHGGRAIATADKIKLPEVENLKSEDEMTTPDGGNIFNLNSKRIQNFCSNTSCKE